MSSDPEDFEPISLSPKHHPSERDRAARANNLARLRAECLSRPSRTYAAPYRKSLATNSSSIVKRRTSELNSDQSQQDIVALRRKARIRQSFEIHRRRGRQRRGEVELRIAKKLWEYCLDVPVILQAVKDVFGAIAAMDEDLEVDNMIIWWRKNDAGNMRRTNWRMFVLDVSTFVDYVEWGKVEEYAAFLVDKYERGKMMMVVVGVDKELRKRRNTVLKGNNRVIVSRQALSEAVAILTLDFGMRFAEFRNEAELGSYIRAMTENVAMEKYFQRDGFLDAMKEYRKSKTELSNVVRDARGNERAELVSDVGGMYQRFLMEIGGVSESTAGAIRKRFPTFRALMNELSRLETDEERVALLKTVKIQRGETLGGSLAEVLVAVLWNTDKDTVFRNR